MEERVVLPGCMRNSCRTGDGTLTRFSDIYCSRVDDLFCVLVFSGSKLELLSSKSSLGKVGKTFFLD